MDEVDEVDPLDSEAVAEAEMLKDALAVDEVDAEAPAVIAAVTE